MNRAQWADEKEEVSVVEGDCSHHPQQGDLPQSPRGSRSFDAPIIPNSNRPTPLICGKPFTSQPNYFADARFHNFNGPTSMSDKLSHQNRSNYLRENGKWRRDPNPSEFQDFQSPANWRENNSQPYWDKYSPPPYLNRSFSFVGDRIMASPSRRLSLQEYKARRQINDREDRHRSNNSRHSPSTSRSDSTTHISEPARNSIEKDRDNSASKIPSSISDSRSSVSERKLNSYGSKQHRQKQSDGFRSGRSNGGGTSKSSSRRSTKPSEEPVILTLSSSDEEDTSKDSEVNELDNKVLCEKEPPLSSVVDGDESKDGHFNKASLQRFGSLHPRIIRIGSYRYLPQHDEDTLLLGSSFKMSVPSIDGQDKVTIIIPIVDIVKSLACFTRSEPLLLIYVKPKIAANIRKHLHMEDKKGFYFDPCSQEQSHRRIALILSRIDDYTKDSLKKIFSVKSGQTPLFEELNDKEAETILMLSTPTHVQNIVKGTDPPVTTYKTILIYPPSPSKGRITISVDDYLCLAEEQFLNDVIIDFYLKWLLLSKLSEVHRQHTHVFSTFFYKRLTFKPKNNRKSSSTAEDTSQLSQAEMRHARVKSWSKGVDIFEKDFIIVPINEKSHWFLAVICFPGLDPPSHAKPELPLALKDHTMQMRSRRKRTKPQSPVVTDIDWSDRDEAEGDDDELEDFDEELEPISKKPKMEAIPSITPEEEAMPTRASKPHLVKQPCILIFDSLAGSSRSRIVATLREYLTIEHKIRRDLPRAFNRDTMPGGCPKVPQQMNYSDCGIYTLQYAESFFEKPLKDYSLPIRSLVDWFDVDIVRRKRESIAKLIHCLMDKTNPTREMPLPELNAKVESEVKQQEAESPFSTSPKGNLISSPDRPSQEENSSNLDMCDFKPITELNPFQGKKINFNLSNKNSSLRKSQSEEIPAKVASSPETPEDTDQSFSPLVPEASKDIHESHSGAPTKPKNILQTIADNYNSDSDDEIFFKVKPSQQTDKDEISDPSELEVNLDKNSSCGGCHSSPVLIKKGEKTYSKVAISKGASERDS